MNYPANPGRWSREEVAEALLDVTVREVPAWAPGLSPADLARRCDEITTTAGASPDQIRRFGHEVRAALAGSVP